MRFKEFIFETLDSTQEFAKKNIDVLPFFSVIEAKEQTCGKTRKKDINWFSKREEGLYITFILPKPVINPISLFPLNFAAYFVNYINTHLYIPLKLKWPNDIYLNGKKLSGILAENYKNRVLLGIGINLYQKDFPKELQNKATSFLKEGFKVDKNEIKEILKFIIIKTINLEFFDKYLYEKYHFLNNKKALIKSGNKIFKGKVLGISFQGELLLQTEDKILKFIEGEVLSWE